MTPSNLITAARDLLKVRRGRPRQSNLCRAVSSAYYAMFHCLAGCCADALVGGSGSDRSRPAWRQAYRALEHGTARQRFRQVAVLRRFPIEVQEFANQFVDMQEKRHKADYDPHATFPKLIVEQDIEATDRAIRSFQQVPIKDRRAFAVYVLLTIRS